MITTTQLLSNKNQCESDDSVSDEIHTGMKVVNDEGDKAKMMVIQPYSSLCVDGIDSKCKFSYTASTTRAEMHNFVNFTNKIIYVIAMNYQHQSWIFQLELQLPYFLD